MRESLGFPILLTSVQVAALSLLAQYWRLCKPPSLTGKKQRLKVSTDDGGGYYAHRGAKGMWENCT